MFVQNVMLWFQVLPIIYSVSLQPNIYQWNHHKAVTTVFVYADLCVFVKKKHQESFPALELSDLPSIWA